MRIQSRCSIGVVAALALLSIAAPAFARIKLAALPERERVEIQLDNINATLVEEERIVPLLQSNPQNGNNRIDFSWSNAYIDKDSIQFRPIAVREGDKFRSIKKVKLQDNTEADEIAVINVAYPPNENALVWEVYANQACAVKVRVSYLISNLSRTFSYRALANKDETEMVLRKFLEVSNYSGEDFGKAGVYAGFGAQFMKLMNQQTDIKILMQKFEKVPVTKTFTFDWYTNGKLNDEKPLASKILMHYKLKNDEKNNLGLYPLQPGKVRIFIDDGKGGEAFLGEDWAQLTPLDGEMKLYLGESQDIVCTRIIEKNDRQKIRGNLFNQEMIIKYEIENFKDKPAQIDIVEQLIRVAQEYGATPRGEVEWEKGKETSPQIAITMEKGGSLPMLSVKLPPRPKEKDKPVEKTIVKFHFTLKNLW
jgi:hypothetical protein